MSTGFECLFFSVTSTKLLFPQSRLTRKNEWYYLLQNWDCPVGAWDWREYASCYGPFISEDAAYNHLSQNHANPGGSMTVVDVDLNKDPVLKKCVEDCML